MLNRHWTELLTVAGACLAFILFGVGLRRFIMARTQSRRRGAFMTSFVLTLMLLGVPNSLDYIVLDEAQAARPPCEYESAEKKILSSREWKSFKTLWVEGDKLTLNPIGKLTSKNLKKTFTYSYTKEQDKQFEQAKKLKAEWKKLSKELKMRFDKNKIDKKIFENVTGMLRDRLEYLTHRPNPAFLMSRRCCFGPADLYFSHTNVENQIKYFISYKKKKKMNEKTLAQLKKNILAAMDKNLLRNMMTITADSKISHLGRFYMPRKKNELKRFTQSMRELLNRSEGNNNLTKEESKAFGDKLDAAEKLFVGMLPFTNALDKQIRRSR